MRVLFVFVLFASTVVSINNENMETRLEKHSLSADEDDELLLEKGNKGNWQYDLCLVGRFLTNSTINLMAIKYQLSNLWGPGKGVNIRSVDHELFVFQFYHQVDLERVMAGSPWMFNNHLLVAHQLQQGETPLKVQLFHVCF